MAAVADDLKLNDIFEDAGVSIDFGDSFIGNICCYLGFNLRIDGLTIKCRSIEEYLEKCRVLSRISARYCHRLLNECPTSYFKWVEDNRKFNLIIICSSKGASKSYNEIISIDYVIDHRTNNQPSIKPLPYLKDIYQQLPEEFSGSGEIIEEDDVVTSCISFTLPYAGNIRGTLAVNVFAYSLESSMEYMRLHGDIVPVNNDYFATEHHTNIYQYR